MVLSQFAGKHYVCVETFKRDGQGVRTPLWFIEENGALYVWTMANSGKAKRIRNNPKVRVVPSTARGRPRGNWIDAEAHLAQGGQVRHVVDQLRIKSLS